MTGPPSRARTAASTWASDWETGARAASMSSRLSRALIELTGAEAMIADWLRRAMTRGRVNIVKKVGWQTKGLESLWRYSVALEATKLLDFVFLV